MIQPIHFRIAGGLLIALALSHVAFPRWFAWRRETAGMSLLNRQMFYVHSFFIALGVFLNGVLFVGWSELLLRPDPLATVVLTGIGGFWLIRLVVQWFVYDRRLWHGHAVKTVIHLLFTCLWGYLTFISFAAALTRGPS